ncbi:TetR family transcriptional regulator [Pseudonocardia nematodicida]|uniref:TetR family transcriptional regulator n=1 Tax=Pseudonocardia nematodicida TaxID=1206997 RepID=A0ABV1K7P6_9PSEU
MLNRDLIISTALEVIDRDGLDTFSMPRLATSLGVRSPSLYYYFEDKQTLLAAVARAIVSKTRYPPMEDSDDWVEWFVCISTDFRRRVLEHPNAAPVLLRYMPRDLFVEMYERTAEFLSRAGIPEDGQMVIIDCLDRLSIGAALTEATRTPEERRRIFAGIDPGAMPRLAGVVRANERDSEQLFADAVRIFLRGAAARSRNGGKDTTR